MDGILYPVRGHGPGRGMAGRSAQLPVSRGPGAGGRLPGAVCGLDYLHGLHHGAVLCVRGPVRWRQGLPICQGGHGAAARGAPAQAGGAKGQGGAAGARREPGCHKAFGPRGPAGYPGRAGGRGGVPGGWGRSADSARGGGCVPRADQPAAGVRFRRCPA